MLALPFLPSALWSRRAGAAACTPPRRFMAWLVPHGMVMPNWTPTTAGATWNLTPILTPLAPIRDKILIVTGLDHEYIAAVADSTYSPAVEGTACFLNMISIDGDDAGTARTSIDQALLPVLNDPSCGAPPVPSMQIGIQTSNGLCGDANCSFARTISWNNGAAIPPIYDPQQVFLQMFGDGNMAQQAADRASILDAVLAEAQSLSIKLSPADRLKLDEHTSRVRNLETRLQRLGKASATNAIGMSCAPPAEPAASVLLGSDDGVTPSAVIQASMPILIELMALAFECDITRAITFMMGDASSNNDYGFLFGGVSAPQYTLSQAEGDSGNLAELTTIDTWEIAQAAALLQTLDGVIEADGQSILDHTTFYLSSDVADGQAGNHWDMPVLLAGGASGGLNIDGRHINYIPQMPFPRPLVGPHSSVETGRVFISILQAHGINQSTFGMATGGPLPELLP
jgi:hypothetical protein